MDEWVNGEHAARMPANREAAKWDKTWSGFLHQLSTAYKFAR